MTNEPQDQHLTAAQAAALATLMEHLGDILDYEGLTLELAAAIMLVAHVNDSTEVAEAGYLWEQIATNTNLDMTLVSQVMEDGPSYD